MENATGTHKAGPDTDLGLPDRDFLDSLGSVIDPADVRWIRLTHSTATTRAAPSRCSKPHPERGW
ncbi:hypothetical protein ACFY0G_19030 [Streptomyces sp. NPDC001552]|uniref:hypothetical protein n=1 Tax=Streptomyces sp. NPDC001552 TaxID=3364587 RepID=UPI0036CA4801